MHVGARGPYHVACAYDGAGLGHMPVLAVRGWARLGRGARLEAQGQVMSSGGNREGRCHAHSEPFNLPAVHVHPCGSQVPVCAVQPEPIEVFAAKHDERTHGGRARREWSGAPASDCPTFGAMMLAVMNRLNAYALTVFAPSER